MSEKSEKLKRDRVQELMNDHGVRFIRFKGAPLMEYPGSRGFKPFNRDEFGRLATRVYGGISENMVDDFARTIKTICDDWSEFDHFIGFADGRVWDMDRLEYASGQMKYVYSSPITPQQPDSKGYKAAWEFLCQLGLGDEDLAADYLQSMAPLLMKTRPTGVVWFVGDGANGKSALINALYRILGDHFASLTVAAIEDGRATPVLNGILGNIVRESSEARVEDTERYKAIGTHEPFAVRKYHTQDNITVNTDFHTIFNGNNIPVFADKTRGARRRTLIVPFKAHFKDNPTFERDTFTQEFLGGLLTLIMEATHVVRDNGYRYKWSDATLRAKEAYDSEVNSAEAFVSYLIQSGVCGFSNYAILKMNYENWCASYGLVPLGVSTLKRTVTTEVNPTRKAVRDTGKVVNRYFFLDAADEDDLVWLDNGYGFKTQPLDEPKPAATAVTNKLDESW